MSNTTNLALPLLAAAQSQKHVTVNESLDMIDDLLGQGHGSLGSFLRLRSIDVELTGLSGASVSSTGLLPDRAIVLGVTSKVTLAVTGATDFSVGVSGDTTKFGSALSVALDSENVGVVGPYAIYAATDVVLTAGGSDFTGGSVKLSAHILEMGFV
jgi:hypothetical protein